MKTVNINLGDQEYRGIKLRLINRKDYAHRKAKRFVINNTNQNVWIPNKHLTPGGTIKTGENLDYIFRYAKNKLIYAGCFKEKEEETDHECR